MQNYRRQGSAEYALYDWWDSTTHTFKMLSNNFIILEYDEKNSNNFLKEICFIYCTCEHSKALAIFQAFTVVPIKLY